MFGMLMMFAGALLVCGTVVTVSALRFTERRLAEEEKISESERCESINTWSTYTTQTARSESSP